MKIQVSEINTIIKTSDIDANQVSDGYHTFGELYDHRIALWIALCREKSLQRPNVRHVWRSMRHSDGELAFGGGWFVLGIGTELGEQLTYHLPLSCWGECDFAYTADLAPTWDGHSSDDVLERIKYLF
jgi:hypothetical protein